MKKKKTENLDFSKLTPKMQIGKIQFSEAYKKAFLKSDKLPESEYSRNTSSED